MKQKTPLTWKANVLLMVANPHPPCSLAWYQLPSPYFPISPHHLPPLGPYYITTTTSTISVFLIWNNKCPVRNEGVWRVLLLPISTWMPDVYWDHMSACKWLGWPFGRFLPNYLIGETYSDTWLISRVRWFFKLTMLHVILDWHKISKTILEKAFFFIL